MDTPVSSLIPQRPPFVMIDSVVSADEQGCSTLFEIAADNILIENEKFTAAGLIENIAQTAAARAGYQALQEKQAVRTGFIGAINNLHIFRLPEVNEILETEIKIENQIFDVTLISGKVSCKGSIVAQCEMKIFMSPAK
jgi:predicted hotdog family 3-hydroxylacyl-ACP dehydratase